MRYQVRREFTWAENFYTHGGWIRISKNHPRLDAMIRSGFISPAPTWFDTAIPYMLPSIGIIVTAIAIIVGIIQLMK